MQFPPVIAADKANHIIYGAAIALIAAVAAKDALIGFGITLLFGAGKEAADWLLNQRAIKAGLLPTHDPDVFDFVATALGGAFTLAALTL